MARALIVSVVAACGGSPTPPTPIANHHAPTPAIDLMLVQEHTATRLRASDAGIVVIDKVALPNGVVGLAWVPGDRDPIALLGTQPWDQTPDTNSQEGAIGHITPAGFVALDLPAFPELPPPTDPDLHPEEHLYFVIDDHDGAWVGHCDLWGGPDGGGCARIRYMSATPPHEVTETAPTDRGARKPPEIAPSTTTIVRLVDEELSPEALVPDRDGYRREARKVLSCTHDGKTVEFPAMTGRDDFYGMDTPTWISTEPPTYFSTEGKGGFVGTFWVHLFVGCDVAPDFDSFHLEVGPSDFVALAGSSATTILWRGHRLGDAPAIGLGGSIVFAPAVR